MTVLMSHWKQDMLGALNPSLSCPFQQFLSLAVLPMSLNPPLGQQGSWIILEESILEITRYKASCAYAGMEGVGGFEAWELGRVLLSGGW